MARLTHGGDISSLHVGGRRYKPDKKGIFEVPDELADELRGHGLWPEGEEAPAPVPTPAEQTAALAEKDRIIADLQSRMAALEERVKGSSK